MDAAFAPSQFESRILQRALDSEDETPCYYWMQDEALIACVLYTHAMRGGEVIGWHLAPVAVHPTYQRRGIGSHLIRRSLREPIIANEAVFVLGDPHYYERFGFKPVKNAQCPYDPGNAHFRALRWADHGPAFTIGYDECFQGAE